MRTDADLAAAFRGGDETACSLLYERYGRVLYVFALRMLGRAEAARDLVQETFLKACERRLQLNHPERFRSWIFAIARNRCLSQLRCERRESALEEAPEQAVAVTPPPDGREAEEEALLIRRALEGLRAEHREVLLLREYQELSYREIAEITGSSESAVKSRIFKARRALHELLAPAFAGRR